jgi:uncharacterized protein with HEPN domain
MYSITERTRSILEHLAEDARDVVAFSQRAGSFETFTTDSLYRKAIVMSIINIGELVKNLSAEFKENHPNIPWRRISGMRDIAAHGYHTMDDSIIWSVATQSIPELLLFIESIL